MSEERWIVDRFEGELARLRGRLAERDPAGDLEAAVHDVEAAMAPTPAKAAAG